MAPVLTAPYTCLDGTTYLVYSTENSYYCADRLGNQKDISEQQLADMCTEDPTCSGYDYRAIYGYGYLCKQNAYPGSSKTCCHYKLCKKTGLPTVMPTIMPTPVGSTAMPSVPSTEAPAMLPSVPSTKAPAMPQTGVPTVMPTPVPSRSPKVPISSIPPTTTPTTPAPTMASTDPPISLPTPIPSIRPTPSPSRPPSMAPVLTAPYTCLDGTTYLVYSTENSYYCADRLGNQKDISEQQLADMCTEDPTCSGYDYRAIYGYGYLCKQNAYPGSS